MRGQHCFVKENHYLSCEQCTVMTVASSSKELKPPPFVFKGKGIRFFVKPPGKVTVQWAEKGSYHIKQMLDYINKLPTIPVVFSLSKRIFAHDDYSVHLPPKIECAFFRKGYFLLHIGGGITGDVQVNDTTYHSESKAAYRKKEMQLMLDVVIEHPDKIPAPSRDQIMRMFNDAWDEVYNKIDCEDVYNKNIMTLLMVLQTKAWSCMRVMVIIWKKIKSITQIKIVKMTKPTSNMIC